jgi:DNA invertase Pin-like site-specific DNA recombinase
MFQYRQVIVRLRQGDTDRVSTPDQTCARQERDLKASAKKAGYKVVGVWKETGSGAKDDRAERKKIASGGEG